MIVSTVPAGAGLSSSAALEVATYTFLEALSRKKPEKPEQKVIAQRNCLVPTTLQIYKYSIVIINGCARYIDN